MAGLQGAGVGRRIPALQRWLGTVAALFDTDAALLIMSHDGLSRVIAGYGIAHPIISWQFDFRAAPYGPDDTVLVADASENPEFHAVLGDSALSRTHFFFRMPIPFPGTSTIALIVFGRDARPRVNDRHMRLAGEIAREIGQEFGELIAPEKAELRPETLGFVYDGLAAWLETHAQPLALIDGRLKLITVNATLRAIRPDLAASPSGADPFGAIPAGDLLRPMMARALETGESTPEIEICHEAPKTGRRRYYSVMGSPIRVVDRPEPLIVVSLRDITREILAHHAFEEEAAGVIEPMHPAEATVSFLAQTLVQRRSLRSRNGVSFVTARAWREPIRTHQIKALKLLKESAPQRLAASIAQDMLAEIDALLGRGAFRSIVPVPCGHSGQARCLSRHVALELSLLLGVPVVEALRLPQSDEGSHPKKNTRRARMSLSRPPEGPALIVDDVATSGAHIEEACRLLRTDGIAVMGLAWIGGNAGS